MTDRLHALTLDTDMEARGLQATGRLGYALKMSHLVRKPLRCSALCARDLKLDNTLLDSNRPQRIKLCDFGFAKAWEAGSKNMFTHIG